MEAPEKRVELLAPAGNKTSLRAALDAGADAIYFGVRGFNMRAAARNFEIDDLPTIVAACRDHGAKAYLALNTVIYEQELPGMHGVLQKVKDAGVDAVICWDPAVISACRGLGVEAHLSTQASVSNSSALAFYYKQFGIKRFVLARECSLEQIVDIQEALILHLGHEVANTIEIEVFAHGAMCVSVSGRCFMSEFSFGRSGNRGDCLQPCRREYRIMDTDGEIEYEIGKDYVLSPEDLATLPFLEKLLDAGVASLKLEGRNRNPEYTATVTKAYRRAIDFYYAHKEDPDFSDRFSELKDNLLEDVRKVYNRGFSSGFYLGKPIDQWSGTYGSKATRKKAIVGVVVNYYRKPQVAEIKVQDQGFSIGDELIFQGPTTGSITYTVDSMEIDHQKVDSVDKGQSVAVKVPKRLRPNDQVFIWLSTDDASE